MKNTQVLNTSTTSRDKAKNIGLWVLKIAFGLMFLGAAGAKLAGVPAMVAEFEQIGLGQWFRYATGVIELVCAILLLVPRTAVYGAALLAVVCVGALIAQLAVIHQDWVHTIVMGGLLAFTAWAQHAKNTDSH